MQNTEELQHLVHRFIIDTYPQGGEGFLTENALAARFSLNRSAARKLLLGMEGEGILQCTSQGYARVDYRSTPRETVDEIRATVEGIAARMATGHLERRDRVSLRLALEDMTDALERNDFAAFDEADEAFHNAVVTAAHDKLLERLFSFISWTAGCGSSREATSEALVQKRLERERAGQSILGHERIYTALQGDDPAESERLVRKHSTGRHHDDQSSPM